jgi:hypothetical protein
VKGLRDKRRALDPADGLAAHELTERDAALPGLLQVSHLFPLSLYPLCLLCLLCLTSSPRGTPGLLQLGEDMAGGKHALAPELLAYFEAGFGAFAGQQPLQLGGFEGSNLERPCVRLEGVAEALRSLLWYDPALADDPALAVENVRNKLAEVVVGEDGQRACRPGEAKWRSLAGVELGSVASIGPALEPGHAARPAWTKC